MAANVRPTGERWVCYVQSRSRPKQWHRVDLEEYNGNGWCGCEAFEFNFWKALEAGAERNPELQCYHIEQAKLAYWHDWFDRLKAIAKMKKGQL